MLITAGESGQVRVWDGASAGLMMKRFAFRRRVESLVLGADPRRVVFGVQVPDLPITWEVPVEDRPLAALEARSVVLSGHLIDGGEGLSPRRPNKSLPLARPSCG